MQLAWADAVQRKTKRPVPDSRPGLIVGPQTVREAEKFGITRIRYTLPESQEDVGSRLESTSPNYQEDTSQF